MQGQVRQDGHLVWRTCAQRERLITNTPKYEHPQGLTSRHGRYVWHKPLNSNADAVQLWPVRQLDLDNVPGFAAEPEHHLPGLAVEHI